MDGHASNDEFFTKLASLIEKTQQNGHGSVHLTQKRLTFDSTSSTKTTSPGATDDPLEDLNPTDPVPVLVRATDGKTQSIDRKKNKEKIKLSTVVQPDDMDNFFLRYAEVCKVGMQSLKKRDRSKRKKDKSKKKKGGGVEEKK